MQTSEQTNELFTALAKAQTEFKIATFDMKGNYGPYASLKSCMDASVEALGKYGLHVAQPVSFDGTHYLITTQVGHSSGQWMRSTFRLILEKQNMQGLGSAVTYAKRYAYAAALGIVSDTDDDAQAAVTAPPKTKPAAPPPKAKTPAPNHAPTGPTRGQIKRLYFIASQNQWPSEAVRVYSLAKSGRTPGQLSKPQYDKLCEFLDGAPYDTDQAAEIDSMYNSFDEKQKARIKGD